MGWGEWRRLVETYLRPQRRLVAVLAVALFATIALQVATPQIVRVFIDRATSPAGGTIGLLTIAYAAAVLLQQACALVTAWLSEQVGWLTTNELRVDLLAHCLALDPEFHEHHPPGELIERVDGDLNGLSTFFAQFLLMVVGSVLLLTGVLVVVWFQDPVAGAVLTAFAVFAMGTMIAVRRVAARAWEQSREASGVLFGYLEERLAGTETSAPRAPRPTRCAASTPAHATGCGARATRASSTPCRGRRTACSRRWPTRSPSSCRRSSCSAARSPSVLRSSCTSTRAC